MRNKRSVVYENKGVIYSKTIFERGGGWGAIITFQNKKKTEAAGLVWITECQAGFFFEADKIYMNHMQTWRGKHLSQPYFHLLIWYTNTQQEREGGYREKAGKGGTLWNILKVLGSIRERPGRLGNIKSMHCNVNWLLTLIICLGSALALSAVTLAGLSKYGMGWNGERWVGGGDRLEWEWEKRDVWCLAIIAE